MALDICNGYWYSQISFFGQRSVRTRAIFYYLDANLTYQACPQATMGIGKEHRSIVGNA